MIFISSIITILCVLNFGFAISGKLALRWASNNAVKAIIGISLGVIALGFIGLIASLAPNRILAIAFLIIANCIAAFVNFSIWKNSRPTAEAIGLSATWVVCALISVIFAVQPAKLPSPLFDGPYVYKDPTADFVRVQALAGDLPADNAIPAFVVEFLAQSVSFTENRPLAPGQEVANRPILMSLAVLPIRLAIGEEVETPRPLPTLSYVGQDWPNAAALLTNTNFRVFLGSATTLNALVSVAFAAFLMVLGVKRAALLGILLSCSSLYVLLHNFFTWPKNLAAFFIVSAWLLIYKSRAILPAGILMGAAYWSHPYALAFAIPMAIYLAGSKWVGQAVNERTEKPVSNLDHSLELGPSHRSMSDLKDAAVFIGIFIAIMASWTIWVQGYLGISGDLLAQNLASQKDLTQLIWIRVHHAANVIFPIAPFSNPVFDANSFTRAWLITLMAPMGIVFYLLMFFTFFRAELQERWLVIFAGILPGLMVVLPFSNSTVPMLHGWQAVWPILLAVTLISVQRMFSSIWIYVLIGLQVITNLSIVGARIVTSNPSESQGGTASVSSTAASSSAPETAARGVVKAALNDPKKRTAPAPSDGKLIFNLPAYYTTPAGGAPSNIDAPVEIKGVLKQSVFSGAPVATGFIGLDVGDTGFLKMEISIHPQVWAEGGDEAIFEVRIIESGGQPLKDVGEVVYSKSINQRGNPAIQDWQPVSVSLKKFAGKKVDIILDCKPGPANDIYADWCIWGNPRIVQQ